MENNRQVTRQRDPDNHLRLPACCNRCRKAVSCGMAHDGGRDREEDAARRGRRKPSDRGNGRCQRRPVSGRQAWRFALESKPICGNSGISRATVRHAIERAERRIEARSQRIIVDLSGAGVQRARPPR